MLEQATWLYFIGVINYLSCIIGFHGLVDINYPFPNHEYENKQKNIIETFNIATNIVVCYNFFVNIYTVNNLDGDYILVSTDNSIFGIQLLSAGLIYESIYYYLILGRQNKMVLIHHVYTVFSLLLYLYYNTLHYYLSIIALVEITNIFLSGLLIGKRNNLSELFMKFNETGLLITYIPFRLISLPFIFYKLISQYDTIYTVTPVPYYNGLFIIVLLWGMSIVWFKSLVVMFYDKRIKND
jgi:hypothetical protein